ncbi:MAG TPA: ATP-binding protein [Gemmatimonadaceae bacterium]|nr:ATP-binding protein [Gemmatimonadaceae bacterium]
MELLDRRVVDSLPLAICTVDLEGRITSANRAWSRVAHTSAVPESADTDLRGLAVWDAIGDPSARQQLEHAMSLLRAGRASTVSVEHVSGPTGAERVFLLQLSPLRDDHAVAGFTCSAADITPCHHSRQALIDSGISLSRPVSQERVYQEVAQQIRRLTPCDGLAIALVGPDAESARLAWHSGFDGPAEAIERRFRPTFAATLAAGRVLSTESDTALEMCAPMEGADGVVGAMLLVAAPIESPQRRGEIERILATVAAQSGAAIERVGVVRQHERKRRLESTGEVAAGVAHELRNPLFGISSAAQLLRFRAREDPVVEKNVGRILREVERLNRMVTALLDYGRPRPLRLTAADPDDVWDVVVEASRGLLESRALRLERSRDDHHSRGMFDTEQLAQAFRNVLVNAIDAAPEASDLALSTSALPGGAWRCRLHNGGPAIPAETLERVFEVFFSTKPGATGIGLALSRRIIEEHAGSIVLESATDGTTCTIVLPLPLPPAATRARPSAETSVAH